MVEERYTHGHGDAVLRSHRWRNAQNSAAYLLPALHSGMALLDVGCGPGNITVDLAQRVAPGRVAAIDASAGIVNDAASQYPASGVEWRVGDVYSLPYEDDTFDVAHAHQVLQHLADPVAALEEMKRVTRPGGLIAARDADYGSFAWYPGDPGLDRWVEVYSAVARANGGEPDAGRHLLAWAHRAGITKVTATVTSWCYASPAERSWWSELWAERTADSPLAERAVELGIADPSELAGIADAWRRWGQHPDAWYAVPSGEILCQLE
jgi:SAM-dependent methyltransferase